MYDLSSLIKVANYNIYLNIKKINYQVNIYIVMQVKF